MQQKISQEVHDQPSSCQLSIQALQLASTSCTHSEKWLISRESPELLFASLQEKLIVELTVLDLS